MADDDGPMTAAQLIEILQRVSGDTLIVLAADGEGNDFSPCAGYTEDGLYRPMSTWSGELVEVGDYDDTVEVVGCVCLWPTR